MSSKTLPPRNCSFSSSAQPTRGRQKRFLLYVGVRKQACKNRAEIYAILIIHAGSNNPNPKPLLTAKLPSPKKTTTDKRRKAVERDCQRLSRVAMQLVIRRGGVIGKYKYTKLDFPGERNEFRFFLGGGGRTYMYTCILHRHKSKIWDRGLS